MRMSPCLKSSWKVFPAAKVHTGHHRQIRQKLVRLTGSETGPSCSSGLAAVQTLRFIAHGTVCQESRRLLGHEAEVESLHGGPERLREAVKVKSELQ